MKSWCSGALLAAGMLLGAVAIGQPAAVCLQLQSIADDNDIEADLLECAG